MSVDNSSTSSLSNRPSEGTQRADRDRPADKPRETPPKEQVDRFRQLMQTGRHDGRAGPQERQERQEQRPGMLDAGRRTANAAAAQHGGEEAALPGLEGRRGTQDGTDNNGMGANSVDGAELLAMMQAQAALREGAGTPPPAAPAPPMASGKALAEMLERHVRQFAVDGAAGTDGDGHVLLRMADATLPGTDLLLSRTADGWHLRADVRSRDSYDAIQQAAPELAKRFAQHNLGHLAVESHFQG